MKPTKLLLTCALPVSLALFAPKLALAQSSSDLSNPPHYLLQNLGTLGGVNSAGDSINDRGWVLGTSDPPGDTATRAALWIDGHQFDLGTLGGPNSAVEWQVKNDNGIIAGISETADLDPLHENWSCSNFFPTQPPDQHICLGFVFRGTQRFPLPTLGGVNGYASGVNHSGEIVGWAETAVHDTTCQPPQVLQFEAALYTPDGSIHELPPLPQDEDGAATDINDRGQVVGISGTCDNAVGAYTAKHSVLWEHGRPTRIPDFGGSGWNTPVQINDFGAVVGFANLPNDVVNGQLNFQPIAFIWSKDCGLQKIEPLPGDTNTIAYGINNRGQVVGQSFGGPEGSRAFLWQDGKIYDLNGLVSSTPSLYLVYAESINNRGEITGEACVLSGTVCANISVGPAFLAVPNSQWAVSGNAPTVAAAPDASATPSAPKAIVPAEMIQRSFRRLGVRQSSPPNAQ